MQHLEEDNDGHTTGRKKFTCPECQTHFKRAEHLARHERSHRKEQPFGCPYCESRFSRADLINRHIRRFHPGAALVDPPKRKKRPTNGAYSTTDDSRVATHRSMDDEPLSNHPIHDNCTPTGSLRILLPPPANMSHVHDSPTYDLSFASPFHSAELSNVRAERSPAKSTEKDVSDMPVERTGLPFDLLPQFFRDMTHIASKESIRTAENDPTEYVQENISKEQLDELRARTVGLKRFECLQRFNLPSVTKIEQYLLAFFKYFVPHSPIIHVKSFNFRTCSPPTLLSILAIGTLYLDERSIGDQLHQMSQILMGNSVERTKPNTFAEIVSELQTRILNIHYGLFSANPALVGTAVISMPTIEKVYQEAEAISKSFPDDRWKDWIQKETLTRLYFWTIQQRAIWSIFIDDGFMLPSNKDIKGPLPCSTKAWEATEEEWQSLQASHPLDYSTCLKSLLRGIPLTTSVHGLPITNPDLSSVGVVTLLCALIIHIATHERLVWHELPLSSETWILDILRALHAWEETWKAHPERTPNPFDKVHGPVMADAIPLLNTAYFHIFAPRLLDRIKGIMREQMKRRTLMPLREVMEVVKPNSMAEREYMLKAAAHAAHSLHVRAKLGYPMLGKISCLDSGFHYGYTGFESSSILSTWIAWMWTCQPERNEAEESLMTSVNGILEEMKSQMGFKEISPALPVMTVASMMKQGWVWGYLTELSAYLLRYGEILTQRG